MIQPFEVKYSILFAISALTILVSCNEQEPLSTQKWYKGNLHTHSYWSDGDEFPEVIMDWYKSHDYQFVALTDHNILAEGDKWKVISSDTLYQKGFAHYLEQFGEDWVTYRLDASGRTEVKLKTYQEYKGRYEADEEFLIIQSEEISDQYEGLPLHLNATNIQENIDPQGGNSVVEVLQNNINAVLQQRLDLDEPMIVHVNHPNFGYAVSLEDMIALRNERYFEVYNGHHMVNNSGDSLHMSTETMWDLINIAYVSEQLPLMYGLATDDSHHYHVSGRKWSNVGRGWIEVRADSLNTRSLIDAMEAGDFYASTGVELAEVGVSGGRLSVEVLQEAGVSYELTFIGYREGSSNTEVLLTITDTDGSIELSDDIVFVRCKVTSSKLHPNPIEDLIYESAWTQPVLVNDYN